MKKYTPYTQQADAWMIPQGGAKFLQTCIFWQLVKFAYYNLKIIKIVLKGH